MIRFSTQLEGSQTEKGNSSNTGKRFVSLRDNKETIKNLPSGQSEATFLSLPKIRSLLAPDELKEKSLGLPHPQWGWWGVPPHQAEVGDAQPSHTTHPEFPDSPDSSPDSPTQTQPQQLSIARAAAKNPPAPAWREPAPRHPLLLAGHPGSPPSTKDQPSIFYSSSTGCWDRRQLPSPVPA